MTAAIRRINPDGLHPTPGYHHITVVEAGRTAYLAGQCPLDVSGALVGDGDLDRQIDQVVANSLTALDAVRAVPGQVVRSTIYVVSDDRTVLASAWSRLNASALGHAFTTASTLLGVAQLGFPGQLVELDLTVALPKEVEFELLRQPERDRLCELVETAETEHGPVDHAAVEAERALLRGEGSGSAHAS